jgi:hypothetical protein
MQDVEISVVWSADDDAREVERYLRAWFEIILDQLSEEALRCVRQECRRAAPSRANEVISDAIARRLER